MTALLDSVAINRPPRFTRDDWERLYSDHLALPQQLAANWRTLARTVADTKRVEQLHEERGEYQSIVRGGIDQLNSFAELCRHLAANNSPPPAFLAEVELALADVRGFHDNLFAKWQTLDDLYALVVQEIPVPTERLKAYAEAHPIPQSWHDEDFTGLMPENETNP